MKSYCTKIEENRGKSWRFDYYVKLHDTEELIPVLLCFSALIAWFYVQRSETRRYHYYTRRQLQSLWWKEVQELGI